MLILRSDPNYPDIKEFISEKLHTKLCDELSEIKFSTDYLPGFVEPLLDKNIFKLIQYAKYKNPEARVEIQSDDVLRKVIKKLYQSGLDRLQISLYDGEEQYKEFKVLGSL